jgi:multidrug efflux pump subunit AcrA (membrane-fusion protein)
MRNHKFVSLLLVLALVALGLAACGGSRAVEREAAASPAASPAATPVDVTTAAAISRPLPRFIEATGSLMADEQSDVAPEVAGRVVAVNVDLGSYVQRGAVLMRLDDVDARLRLEQAEAQAAQAAAAARQAEERIGLKPNQPFKPEDVAEVKAARAALDLAEKQLQRHERLIEAGDVSRSAYDQQKAQRDQLREQYEAALAQARQSYEAVRTQRAAAEAARAQLAQARKAVTDVVVRAPISGYVAERPADVGEYVTTSSRVATIVRTNPLRLRIDIPEQISSTVKLGQSVTVTVSSYPDRTFNGRVARISPSLNTTSRTLTIEAEVENGDALLKPGQFATVRVAQPVSEPAVLIPQRAVTTESGVSRAFVVKNGRVEQRLVQLGQVEGDLVEIKNGISAGEVVATSNLDKLQDGAPVRQ